MSNPRHSQSSINSSDDTNYQSTPPTPRMTADTDDEQLSVETVKAKSGQNKRRYMSSKNNDDWSRRLVQITPVHS